MIGMPEELPLMVPLAPPLDPETPGGSGGPRPEDLPDHPDRIA